MYKIEKQKRDNERLNNIFKRDNVPSYIQKYFVVLGSSNSKINYYITIKSFLENKVGKTLNSISIEDIKNLEYTDIIQYLDDLLDNKYALLTVKTKKDELSSFFNYLLKLGYMENNIVSLIPKNKYYFKIKKDIDKYPSFQDIDDFKCNLCKITNHLSRVRNIIVLELLIGSGIRESELIGLNLSDVYLEGELPYIITLRKGSYYAEQAEKTYISVSLANKLKRWINFRNEYFKNTKLLDENALILNRKGKRYNEDDVKKMFKKYSGKISPHMLRHYYITKLLHETNDLPFVQEQIGHRVGSTTAIDYYATGREESRKVVRDMN